MENFTPFSGLAGGMLIGLAAAILLLMNGRISGVSGILGSLLTPQGSEVGWRAAFAGGLVLGAAGYLIATDGSAVEIQASLPVLVVAGLLVGFGTRLGSGCTSGHGVCGIARLSWRSISATAVFFAVASLTVFFTQHVF
ncbi:YeeE/YedE family protein [Rubrobacter aplysinae]|uniref:YeeE/YedE family protein n=1 Tax=Rubrobacter aplysinae TaxID=909625 RepID=UPI00064C1536|nr:YeeE/YedE family protein [Rubrobacter aplysinae]